MATAPSVLRTESRRHLLMNVGLVASFVIGGTVVTNERGLFVPISFHGGMSAFAAMFTQSRLLPEMTDPTNMRMVSPLDPFEVLGDPRDLRRRLMDAMGADGGDVAELSDQTLTPAEVTANGGPRLALANGGGAGGAGGAAGDAGAGSGAGEQGQSQNSQSQSAQSDNAQDANVLANAGAANARSTTDLTEAQTVAAANNAADATAPSDTPVGSGVAAVPEPSTWAMLIAGFGMIGSLLRAVGARRRRQAAEPA